MGCCVILCLVTAPGCSWFGTSSPPVWIDGSSKEYPTEQYLVGVGRADNATSASENAYAAVITIGSQSSFYEQSLYKHGWSLFKQSNVEGSAASLLQVLDLKLQGRPGVEVADLGALSRPDRELVLDTQRVLGIQFAANEPADSLSRALDRHGWPVYSWRLYASLGDLLVEKERYTDAADTYRSFAARSPDSIRSPELQSRVESS